MNHIYVYVCAYIYIHTYYIYVKERKRDNCCAFIPCHWTLTKIQSSVWI